MMVDAERRGLLGAGRHGGRSERRQHGRGARARVRGARLPLRHRRPRDDVERQAVGAARARRARWCIARADVEADDPEGYIGRAAAVARELGAFMPDQFENPANPGAHFASTGPEILADCERASSTRSWPAWAAAARSGALRASCARSCRACASSARCPIAASARATTAESLVEGIIDDLGDCAQPEREPDDVVTVGDRDAVAMTLRLAREEGILAGGSAGVAVCAAIRVARELGPGKRVVTLVPDTGRNYLSTYFDDAWERVVG